MRDPVVDQAAHPFQELDARVLEVAARGFRPAALNQRQHGAEEAAVFGGSALSRLFFHFKSPSFPRSEFYFPTLRGWGKGRPSKSAVRCGGAACRFPPPTRRPS